MCAVSRVFPVGAVHPRTDNPQDDFRPAPVVGLVDVILKRDDDRFPFFPDRLAAVLRLRLADDNPALFERRGIRSERRQNFGVHQRQNNRTVSRSEFSFIPAFGREKINRLNALVVRLVWRHCISERERLAFLRRLRSAAPRCVSEVLSRLGVMNIPADLFTSWNLFRCHIDLKLLTGHGFFRIVDCKPIQLHLFSRRFLSQRGRGQRRHRQRCKRNSFKLSNRNHFFASLKILGKL